MIQAKLLSEPVSAETKKFVSDVIIGLGDRLKIFSDILDAKYFFRDDFPVDEKTFDKRVRKEGVPAHLAAFRQKLATVTPFDVPTLEAALNAYSQETGEQAGTLIHALRLSTTGQGVGPGVYDCLVLLGQEKSLARIDAALAKVSST